MKREENEREKFRRKLKGLCAWLSAFAIVLTVVGSAAPLEVLAAEHYGILNWNRTEWRDLPDSLYPGDIVGIWSGSRVGDALLTSPAKLQYLDADGNNIEEEEWPTEERYTDIFAIVIIDYPSNREVPEGQQFICWHVKECVKEDGYRNDYMAQNETVTYASIVLEPVFEPVEEPETQPDTPEESQEPETQPDTPEEPQEPETQPDTPEPQEPETQPDTPEEPQKLETQVPVTRELETQNESPEQIFLRKWAAWIVDPENYLSSVTNAGGTEERSAVPTEIKSNSGFGFIVAGRTEEAERAFEKTSSENQIVVTFDDAYPGEQMQSVLEEFAAAQGATLENVFEINAVERGKTDYSLVREIGATAEAVTYRFALNESIRNALAAGRSLVVIQYVPELQSFLTLDTTEVEENILTIRTQYPSGTFAFFLR